MAAEISWHRYGTKLHHCHPMFAYVRACLLGTQMSPAKTDEPIEMSFGGGTCVHAPKEFDTTRYDTRDAILMCAEKLT